MKRLVRLKVSGIKRLKFIRNEIQKFKRTCECPYWDEHVKHYYETIKDDVITFEKILMKRNYEKDCSICRALFPLCSLNDCPCNIYTPEYLIKRLNEIIEFNLQENKK